MCIGYIRGGGTRNCLSLAEATCSELSKGLGRIPSKPSGQRADDRHDLLRVGKQARRAAAEPAGASNALHSNDGIANALRKGSGVRSGSQSIPFSRESAEALIAAEIVERIWHWKRLLDG